MTERQTRNENATIDRLIAFFKSLKAGNPGPGRSLDSHCDSPIDPEDDSARNQTEAEYQAEQARWLADIHARKQAKTEPDK